MTTIKREKILILIFLDVIQTISSTISDILKVMEIISRQSVLKSLISILFFFRKVKTIMQTVDYADSFVN